MLIFICLQAPIPIRNPGTELHGMAREFGHGTRTECVRSGTDFWSGKASI